MMAVGITAMAQETYEAATITDKDLNGTARYVGMGGAMDALGADLSTISSNPAGIGMFRKTYASITGGVMITGNDADPAPLDGSKANVSFDQIGVVLSFPNSAGYLNLAFNYHKSKNFNQIFSANDELHNASQNKLAWMDGGVEGYTQIDKLYGNTLVDIAKNNFYLHARDYDQLRRTWGYVSNYDFNISGNVNDRFYYGVTFGVKDLRYDASTSYVENMVGSGYMEVVDERMTRGTGFDFTFGAIVRPIESSPFRIGLSVATPTFYRLTTSNDTYLYNKTGQGISNPDKDADAKAYYDYDFSLNTPWKFGVSLGTTFGNYLALGAGYDFSDYASQDNRVRENDRYYYESYDNSYSDKAMNVHTKKTLRGVHTLKVGAEIKPLPDLAIRLGYNYVSPKYKMSGVKEGWIDSWGSDCASQTDYVNWAETNRFTLGFGFQMTRNLSLDIAYQYSNTNGEYHPFADSTYGLEDWEVPFHDVVEHDAKGYFLTNYADAVKVKNTRHQLMLTLGYRF